MDATLDLVYCSGSVNIQDPFLSCRVSLQKTPVEEGARVGV